MVLELCRVSPNLLNLPVLLQPELPQLLILLVLWDGHILLLGLVHAWWGATILHSLMHLHHPLQGMAHLCQSLCMLSRGLVIFFDLSCTDDVCCRLAGHRQILCDAEPKPSQGSSISRPPGKMLLTSSLPPSPTDPGRARLAARSYIDPLK